MAEHEPAGDHEELDRDSREARRTPEQPSGREAQEAPEEPHGRGPGETPEETLGRDGGAVEDDEEQAFADVEDEEEEEERAETVVTIEISGLSLFTHHGVTPAEREVGQRLVLDLRLDVGESDATVTDRLADTVDYAEVCQLVALVAQQRSYRTLERLCSAVADRLLADFEIEAVWVKAAKPEPPIPLPVDEVCVEVWREAGE